MKWAMGLDWCVIAGLVMTVACSDPVAGGSHEDLASVRLPASACEGSSIVVDGLAETGFKTIESAFDCLADRRLDDGDTIADDDVEVKVRRGVYTPFLSADGTETADLVIDHPDAARITLRGEKHIDVTLAGFNSFETVSQNNIISHYLFTYDLTPDKWKELACHLHQLPAQCVVPDTPPPGEAYALIRRTRKVSDNVGLNHAIHQGVWQIDIPKTLDKSETPRLVVLLKYRPQSPTEQVPRGLDALPDPLDAEFDAGTPPIASILTSVLKFKCSAGILVDGSPLKRVEDLVLVGDYDSSKSPVFCPKEKARNDEEELGWSANFPGIQVQRGGGVDLSFVGISSFDGQGVSVYPNSWAVASLTAASGNERRGFYPTFTAAGSFSETIASGNHKDGYISDHSSYTKLKSTLAIGNTENGYNSIMGAKIHVVSSTATLNGETGFASIAGGNFWFQSTAVSSDVFRNRSIGVLSQIGGDMRMLSLRIEGNDDDEEEEEEEEDHLGIRFELGVRYSHNWSVANHDGADYGAAKVATLAQPLPRKLFEKRQPSHISPRKDLQSLFVVQRPETGDPEIPVNPLGSGVRSLHDFFNVPGPNSIADKRIVMPTPAHPSRDYLTLTLGAGVFPYTGRPIVIHHPDARRVKIRGTTCELLVRSTKDTINPSEPLNSCPACEGPACEAWGSRCKHVKVELEPNDCQTLIRKGDFISFAKSDYDPAAYHPHWVHRGVWQVSKVDLPDCPTCVRVRHFGGAALEEAASEAKTVPSRMPAYLMRSVLYFPDSAGIVVDGTAFGGLKDVVLVGAGLPLITDGTNWSNVPARSINVPSIPDLDRTHCIAQGYDEPEPAAGSENIGLKIQNCGHAYYDGVAVTGFSHAGVRVTHNSSLLPWPYTNGYLSGELVVSANGGHGIEAINDGTIWAKASVATANGGSGYYASRGGALGVALSASAANGRSGYEVIEDGYAEAGESAAIRNARDGVLVNRARFAASISKTELREVAVFAENGAHGVRLENNAYAALNGSWSIGHCGSNDAGIHLSGGSKCRCGGVTLLDNYYPMLATTDALVRADASTCPGVPDPIPACQPTHPQWSVESDAVIEGQCTPQPAPGE